MSGRKHVLKKEEGPNLGHFPLYIFNLIDFFVPFIFENNILLFELLRVLHVIYTLLFSN